MTALVVAVVIFLAWFLAGRGIATTRAWRSLHGTEKEGVDHGLLGAKVLLYGGCYGCEACPHFPWWRATIKKVGHSDGEWVVEFDREKVVTTGRFLGFSTELGFVFERTVTVVGGLESNWWTDTQGDTVLCDWITKRLLASAAREKAEEVL